MGTILAVIQLLSIRYHLSVVCEGVCGHSAELLCVGTAKGPCKGTTVSRLEAPESGLGDIGT